MVHNNSNRIIFNIFLKLSKKYKNNNTLKLVCIIKFTNRLIILIINDITTG